MAENEIQIKVDQIGELTPSEEQRLCEITDVDFLSIILEVVPQLALKDVNAGAVLDSNGLYRVLIPMGEHLRARKISFDPKKILGNIYNLHYESFTTINYYYVTLESAVCTTALISCQYYMERANRQLAKINESIDKISVFRKQKFESKIVNICSSVRRHTEVRIEVMVYDDQRKEVLSKLSGYEKETCQLIQQTNRALANTIGRNCRNYESYENRISEIMSWHEYQQILLNILYEIEILMCALDFGEKPAKSYYSAYIMHSGHSRWTYLNIRNWHLRHIWIFRISLNNKKRRPRWGFFTRKILARMLPIRKLLTGSLRPTSSPVPNQTIEMINKQKDVFYTNQNPRIPLDIYDSPAQLIIKDGKLYYLPRVNDQTIMVTIRSLNPLGKIPVPSA